MVELLSRSVTPLYAQVAIFDPEQADSYPDWADGSEEVVATSHGLAIGTIADLAGDVTVTVVRDEANGSSAARLLFEGVVSTSSDRFLVGSVAAGELYEIRLASGRYKVSVETTSPRSKIEDVVIRISEDESRS